MSATEPAFVLSSPAGRLVERSLRHAYVRFGDIVGKDGAAVAKEGGAFGDAKDDTELKADESLGRALMEPWLKWGGIGRVTVEGVIGDHRLTVDGSGLWVCIDPLDGSLNFKKRHGTLGLPITGVVTVLQKTEGARFRDVVAAGIVDYRSGDLWLAETSPEGVPYAWINGVRAAGEDAEKIDLGRMVVVGETYYPDNRALACEMFRGEKGWFRSPGSAAYEMACVANGTVAATFCGTQKQHELGAAYAIVKGAGGTVCDFEGRPLDDVPFTFNVQTPAICAGNRALADDLVARIAKARTTIRLHEELIGYGRAWLERQPESR